MIRILSIKAWFTARKVTGVSKHYAASLLAKDDTCDAPFRPGTIERFHGSCGTRAYVIVVRGFSRLDFCAHHYSRFEGALFLEGWVLLEDDRYLLGLPAAVS